MNEDKVNHCKDCCCARSWAALGVTEYTGKSIPEHIEEMRARIKLLERTLRFVHNCSTVGKNGVCQGCTVSEALKPSPTKIEPEEFDRTTWVLE